MNQLNGVPADIDQLSRLALTNYGHFTTMRVENHGVCGLSLHLDRLARDCRLVFGTDLDVDRVRHFVRQATSEHADSVVVRVTIFDPALEIGHPATGNQPQVLVTSRNAPPQPSPSLQVQTVEYCRDAPNIKHVGIFGLLQQRRRAQLNGYDDALFADSAGYISEGPTWNIGFVNGDQIIWPQADVLRGVTMALIQSLVSGSGVTEVVTAKRFDDMQAAFATNATMGVRVIDAIDGAVFSTRHPLIDQISADYLAIPAEPL